MTNTWTFGQKIAAGFAVIVALAIATGGVATYALRTVVSEKDRVLAVNAQNLIDAEKVRAASEHESAGVRAYLLTGDDRLLQQVSEARSELASTIARLRSHVVTDEGRRIVDEIEKSESGHQAAQEQVFALRRGKASPEAVASAWERDVMPRRAELSPLIAEFVDREEKMLADAQRSSTEKARAATNLMFAILVVAVLFATGIGVALTRSLTRQIAAAIQHIQNSSTELQAAANQQATGAKEQAMAMTEITTTINELLVTSRQIAESAQRVAQIAAETASGAGSGDRTVAKAHDAIVTIKRQVEVIVNHMVDLGRKSQQIGSVLEIVNELSEQTNILATNATIEAAGAGDHGRRFGVVADEIRKLADRVGGSTKEIRGLIEEIRAAVNATVMATEGGSKAVDLGTREFSDVATAFRQIADLVGTTTEAAREIELSTKQQATAVEQVNLAVANVAQASKETETSSSQTLQTATQLTTLSRQLSWIMKPDAQPAHV